MAKKASPPKEDVEGEPSEEKDVVELLRDAILESGQSLNDLTSLAGLHAGQLSRFMRGERDLTLSAASKLCTALDLTLTARGAPAPKRQPKSKPTAPRAEPPAPPARPKRRKGGPSNN